MHCLSKMHNLFYTPIKTGMSSVTIFGMLKSRNARINTSSSGRPGMHAFLLLRRLNAIRRLTV